MPFVYCLLCYTESELIAGLHGAVFVDHMVLEAVDSITQHIVWGALWKLDGVGPVDNRPSTDELHQKLSDT